MPIAKTVVQDQRDNDEELVRQLDWVDKLRGDKKAQPQFFQLRSLVHRRVFENTVEVGAEKLQSNWEGPYVVTKAGYSGAYHL